MIETNPFILNEVTDSNQTLSKQTLILGAEYNGPYSGLYNNSDCSNVHLFIIPDQYFVNSLMNEYIGGDFGDYRNFDFLVNSLLKLNGETELAQMQENMGVDKSLYKIAGNESYAVKVVLWTYLIMFAFIPLVLIVLSIFMKKEVRHEKN